MSGITPYAEVTIMGMNDVDPADPVHLRKLATSIDTALEVAKIRQRVRIALKPTLQRLYPRLAAEMYGPLPSPSFALRSVSWAAALLSADLQTDTVRAQVMEANRQSLAGRGSSGGHNLWLGDSFRSPRP